MNLWLTPNPSLPCGYSKIAADETSWPPQGSMCLELNSMPRFFGDEPDNGLDSFAEWRVSVHNAVLELQVPRVSTVEWSVPLALRDTYPKVPIKNSSWWSDAGQRLQELQTFYNYLHAWVDNPCKSGPVSGDVVEPTVHTVEQLWDPSLIGPLEKYVTVCRTLEPPAPRLINFLVRVAATQMLRYTAALIRKIAALFFGTATTFCGLSWPKRVWCLLHGSHPPKSERGLSRLAFGCS